MKDAIERGMIDGLVLTATTTAAIMVASQIERGEPWGAVNAICHMVDGESKTYSDDFDSRDTPLGIALSGSAMVGWGVIYEMLFGKKRWPKSILPSVGLTAAAYVIDYHIVPKRFAPGFEKKISGRGILGAYVVMALTLAGLGAVHQRRD